MGMIGNYRRLSEEELASLVADPSRVPAFLYGEAVESAEHLDVDKSWHAIHFLLNGQKWEGSLPLFDAVLGGDILGEEDVGYGPARYLIPSQVRVVADALAEIPAFELLEHFDAAALNDADIYPQHWTGADIDGDYIKQNYLRLVEFFRTASNRGQAMLLYIN